jgi:V/A-type H+-transporting ATPase subunit I
MIVPMQKVSLVVMDKSRDASLEELRRLGVVHLEKRNVSSAKLSGLLDQKARTETALGILLSYPVDSAHPADAKRPKDAPVEAGGAVPEPRDLADQVLSLAEEKKTLQEQLTWNTKERSRIEKWGDFKPGLLAELREQGITLIPYEIAPRAYEALNPEQRLILLGKDKTAVYFAALEAIPGESPWLVPEKSLSELDAASGAVRGRLAEIETRLWALAPRNGDLTAWIKTLAAEIEFETARVGMDLLEDAPSALTVSWITGFMPQEDLGILKRAAAENGWAFVADDPAPDDPVPTKLKNNPLVSLIYPLTDFLEVVPGYNEADISGWFLLFFCIFFGMIFGDAGYGLLLALIGIIGIIKTSKKGVPAMLKMLMLLSLSNIAWGVATCTWFGVDAANLPEVLRRISVPLISNAAAGESAAAKALVDQNLQIFCFSLALLQLSVAHLKGIIRNIQSRSLKLFGELGSLGMLIGMFNVVLALVVSNSYRKIPFLPLSLYLIVGGFALSFVFAGYEGSIIKSILYSLQNIISVILGITNVFSDIMSYIRLWAVGLAGASISATVNTMAGPLLGNFLIFLGIILLVFGHGLNIILNVLSVLVHGVRLNTLEFSGHLGLTWSGTAYRPFAKTDKK